MNSKSLNILTEVLIEVSCVGICGSDVKLYSSGKCGADRLIEPIVIGHEGAGKVVKVSSLQVGDRVAIEPTQPCRACEFCKQSRYNLCHSPHYCSSMGAPGNLCRYYKHVADFCHKIPDNLSMEEGAAVQPLAIAIHACNHGAKKIAILGAGPIGILSAMTARAMGATNILITDVVESRLATASALGADHTLLTRGDSDDYIARNIVALLGDAPDVTIDACGYAQVQRVAMNLKDSHLTQIVKPDSCLERLSFENCPLVTGHFLLGSKPRQLHSLSFFDCPSLQGTVLCAAMDTLPHLTALKLDEVPDSTGNMVPMILKKLPRLRELYFSGVFWLQMGSQRKPVKSSNFCESLANLTELRVLDLSCNAFVGNAVLKQIAQSCTELVSLDIYHCNGSMYYDDGVTDEGVEAICTSCRSLSHLNVSDLRGLTDAGLRAAARLPRLTTLISRSNSNLSSAPFAAAIAACHTLQVGTEDFT